MKVKALLLVNLVVMAVLMMGAVLAQTPPVPDGAHIHPRYETQIADLQQDVATLYALTSSAPAPSAAPTRTNIGTTTPTPEIITPFTATPTFAPGTNTPTPTPNTTPVPTTAPQTGCMTATGDFLAFTKDLRRRSSPEIRTDNLYANQNISDTVAEPVCIHTLHVDSGGYRWIQIASTRPEWTAVSRTVNGTTEYYGTLTDWGASTYPFTVEGNRLYLNGDPFKFTGVNFRELIGYDNRIMPYASPSDIAVQLDGAKALGMRVVRFYASHESLTVEQAIPRVRNILNMLQNRGMYAIIVLTDGAYSNFEIADNAQNRAVQGIDRYTHRFFEGGYKENYLPYVDALTKAIGAHDAILFWEPGNEFTTVNLSPTAAQMDAFINFYAETSAVIRRNSPGKLISTGLESCYQLFVLNAYDGGKYCEKLYTITDAGTLHTYQENTGQVLGSSWMHIVREMQIPNQPLIIEETNTMWANESTDWLAALVKAIFNRLSGIMHWNMSFPYCRDLGVGDGATNACAGSAQARRWFNITGFYRSLADQLRLNY